MVRAFVDTSALLALMVSSDRSHLSAKKIFAGLQDADAELITALRALPGISQVCLALHRPWASDR